MLAFMALGMAFFQMKIYSIFLFMVQTSILGAR